MNVRLLTVLALLFVSISPQQAHAQTSSCEPGEAEALLDANNVKARILNTGGLFWRGTPSVYRVPKFGTSNAIFVADIWVAGQVDGEIRTAASRYGPWEFWPGPLDEQGNPPADCKPYDKIYNIYLADIQEYEASGIASEDLQNWPWELGAPVIDGDGIPDNYNLAGGDRPEVRGHQTLWWVMNDRGNSHDATNATPLGLEVQVTVFAARSDEQAIDNATLYKYKIINKNDNAIEEAYVGFFKDVDLGNFSDDYVGSDSTLGLGYVYNADNNDEGGEGYGVAPPAIGLDILQGPLASKDGIDNDKDGSIDEDGERLSMTSLMYFTGGGVVTGDPVTKEDYYGYLRGIWKDGQTLTLGGNGRDFSNIPAHFAFPGDPATGEGWSMVNPDPENGTLDPIDASDMRFIHSSGPFTMMPGEAQEIVYAVIWARGADNLDAVTELKAAAASVQEAFEAGFNIPEPTPQSFRPLELLSPANGTLDQPVDLSVRWQPLEFPTDFQVVYDTSPSFSSGQLLSISADSIIQLLELLPSTTYYWRVRAIDGGTRGPWSETWIFTTSNQALGNRTNRIAGFMTTQNAAGPLTPPDMAAFAFNDSGFPVLEGTLTPEGSYPESDRPTVDVQQSTNSSVWGIHTGGTTRSQYENDNGQSFLERTVRNGFDVIGTNDFEWRFPQECFDTLDGVVQDEDCLAVRRFSDNAHVEVPFQIWNTGTLPDTTDDFRLVPVICEEMCGAGSESGVFDLAQDHMISGGDNDPFTDWIYWNAPGDKTPGRQGYDAFFAGTDDILDEIFARMVLVQHNGGSMPPYVASLPEPGTVFRIVTEPLPPPFLSAPANEDILSQQSVSLFWQSLRSLAQIQIDVSPDFSNPIVDQADLLNNNYSLDSLATNQTYFWRVRNIGADGAPLTDWSVIWSFTIPLNVSIDGPGLLPATYVLEQNYPNPFAATTTIQYAIPSESHVNLEVFDLLGRRIKTLVDERLSAGRHEARFEESSLSSGVYYYRLTAGDFTDTRSMILMR